MTRFHLVADRIFTAKPPNLFFFKWNSHPKGEEKGKGQYCYKYYYKYRDQKCRVAI
jgi:hypothetical protein